MRTCSTRLDVASRTSWSKFSNGCDGENLMSKQRRDTGRPLGSGSSLSYRAARGTIRGVASFFFKPEITGYENMPLEGPVILAPVHRSLVDFTFTIFVTRRMLFFMAKEELWRSRVLAAWFPTVGVFPVHRDAPDRKSLSRAEDVLKQGGVLVMFPEGARQSGQEIGEL